MSVPSGAFSISSDEERANKDLRIHDLVSQREDTYTCEVWTSGSTTSTGGPFDFFFRISTDNEKEKEISPTITATMRRKGKGEIIRQRTVNPQFQAKSRLNRTVRVWHRDGISREQLAPGRVAWESHEPDLLHTSRRRSDQLLLDEGAYEVELRLRLTEKVQFHISYGVWVSNRRMKD